MMTVLNTNVFANTIFKPSAGSFFNFLNHDDINVTYPFQIYSPLKSFFAEYILLLRYIFEHRSIWMKHQYVNDV